MEKQTTYSIPEILQAVDESAIWVDLSAMGRLEASERDRLDLPNRLSTNKIDHLAEGQGLATIFTTAIGRVIDRVVVLNHGQKALYITGANRAERVSQWLNRNVFFNDEFQLRDLSEVWSQIGVMGDQSAGLLERWFPGAKDLPRYGSITATVDDNSEGELVLVRVPDIASHTFWLLGPQAAIAKFAAQLNEAGAIPAGREVYDYLRIQARVPDIPELTEDYIPLELGLWEDVSFNKGCYIGQEIIARMESRGKLAKMLVRVQSPVPLKPGITLLSEQGANAGTITSLASMAVPDENGYPGLAVVKSAFANQETELYAETGQEKISVRLVGPAGTYMPK
jgi:aminomethyltransferase